ncbi:MAG: 50S ribosomal protein L31e [Candidatus Altiarchaeota archaeon]|nr:50S ribosomal protein L31e [Candidatus Altiarchaeota archaeon]
MAEETIFKIPLGSVYQTRPNYRRSNKAVAEVKSFLGRHMKAKEVKISQELNEKIMSRGSKRPPRSVQVKAVKDEEGICTASLVK